MRKWIALLPVAMFLTAACAWGQATTREETADGVRRMILENDALRLTVLPNPGGTVIEFVHKKTGTNFVAGADYVLKGRLGWGWVDFIWLQAPEKAGQGIYVLPYHAEFRAGPGWKSIFVSCETEGLRIEREMRLGDRTPELTVLIKHTNISDAPRRLQVRWHAYSMVGDPYAENSCIIAPDRDGEVRKCFIGSGWDHQFVTADGYWLAANARSGEGLWMTFRKEQSVMHITWTDYNSTRKHPLRGAFVAEPFPAPVLALPGQSVLYEGTFYPLTADEKPESVPLGVLTDAAEKDRARQFLSMVKPNLAAIESYTMTPGKPPAGLDADPKENRFSFSHRRRDRFALRPWGMLDAMMAVPSLQGMSIRCRYFARLFDGVGKPLSVSFRLAVTDPSGKVVKEQKRDFTLDPTRGRELDMRDDIPLAGLPDGSYKFTLEGYVQGEAAPIHRYEENRRLVGEAKPAYDKLMAAKAAAPLAERPFVTALRAAPLPPQEKDRVAVPIGVEDGSGVARQGWPVRLGVPFAQGLLPKDAAFDLIGPDGKPVIVQTAAMATWLDGSLKWLLVDFAADVPPGGHVFYTLKNAPAPASHPESLVRSDAPAEARLLGLFGPEDLWWQDGRGEKFYFQLKGEGAGIVVEENGPVRAVRKATGWYVNNAGRAVCMGELRLEQYRGRNFTRLYHTVVFAGDAWKDKLGSYGICFNLPEGAARAQVEMDGQEVSGSQVTVFQRHPDDCEVTCDGRSSRGARSSGAVLFEDEQKRRTGYYLRDFWQMAPKEIVADSKGRTVTFSYWPAESGAMGFLPREDGWIPNSSTAEAVAVGMSRTHEFILSGGPDAVPAAQCEKTFGEPVVAIVPPKYLASTKAMLHLSPYDPERYPQLERFLSDTIDFYQSQRELFGWYGEWVYGGIPNFWNASEYRWLDFGRYAWILNEEDIVDGPWLCYLRSGDRKYLKFAEINTRHLMEVGTIRWNPVWPEYVGLSRRHHECIWLSGGDTGHSMLDPFVDCYHATGYRPAWEAAERMAGAMAKVRSGTWRYISNPVAGLARMYLETQNPFYKEHADRIWNTLCYPEKNEWWVMDHGERMVLWYSQLNPQCRELWKAWTLNPEKKGRFAGADVLTARYLETGEVKYAEAARKAIPLKVPELTQHVLAGLRAWCYAGEALAAVKQDPGATKPPR